MIVDDFRILIITLRDVSCPELHQAVGHQLVLQHDEDGLETLNPGHPPPRLHLHLTSGGTQQGMRGLQINDWIIMN